MIKLNKKEKDNILFTKEYTKLKSFKKLCLFSHFDKDDIIDKYVIFAIKELYKLDYEIVFITTSEKIKNSELQKIAKYLKLAIVKKNIGYDFIAWKTGLSLVPEYKKYETILHMNDSIFFPLHHPKKMFDTMKYKKVDFWGINDRLSTDNFIHSFFWVFNKRIIKSKFYQDYWNNCKTTINKLQLVRNYEMSFTPLLKQKGFKTSTYINIEDVASYAKQQFDSFNENTVLFSTSYQSFWDILIKEFKSPYIKKNILNSSHVDFNIGTIFWKEFLNKYTIYDPKVIENYLHRIRKSQNKNFYDNFYNNLNSLIIKTKKLTKNNDYYTLYAYCKIGIFFHAILDKKISNIVDIRHKTINMNNKLKGIDTKIISPKELTNFEKIIVTAFGREEEIKSYLSSLNIPHSNVIIMNNPPENHSSLKLNITRLSLVLQFAYIANLKKNIKISLINTNNNLAKICQKLMSLENLTPLPIITDKSINNCFIIFNVKSLDTNNSKNIPFYIN